jgi:hypothetical protein
MSTNYPQSFQVAKLFRRKSEKGNTYFVGRWGGARVTVLKSKETTDDGTEVWALMLGEAKRDNEASQRQEPPRPEPERQQAARSSWQKPLDDEIPF